MYALKSKITILLAMTAFLAVALALPVQAAAHINVFGYVDKPQYKISEQGTLNLWLYNDGTEDVILKNITIEYPWHADYIWEGNETIKDIDEVVAVKGNWSTSTTFTIPSDGRATSGNIYIYVVTDKYETYGYIYLNVAASPYYAALQDMDKLQTLFTLLVVLVIVCTIIIAAAIFLSGHKSQVVWNKEKE